MQLVQVFNFLTKARLANSVKTVQKLVYFNMCRNVVVQKVKGNLDIRPKVEKDVVLFNLVKPRFFLYLNLFSAGQCALWTYLGFFMLNSFHPSKINNEKKRFWQKVIGDQKYNNLLSAICIIFGTGFFLGSLFYTSRSITKIILHKGGRNVSIINGFKNCSKLLLSEISAAEHRTNSKNYLSFRIKNKYFFYILDTSGNFPEPELFDFTVGIKRNM